MESSGRRRTYGKCGSQPGLRRVQPRLDSVSRTSSGAGSGAFPARGRQEHSAGRLEGQRRGHVRGCGHVREGPRGPPGSALQTSSSPRWAGGPRRGWERWGRSDLEGPEPGAPRLPLEKPPPHRRQGPCAPGPRDQMPGRRPGPGQGCGPPVGAAGRPEGCAQTAQPRSAQRLWGNFAKRKAPLPERRARARVRRPAPGWQLRSAGGRSGAARSPRPQRPRRLGAAPAWRAGRAES